MIHRSQYRINLKDLDSNNSNETIQKNLYLSYLSPRSTCFTRKSEYIRNSIRIYDLITLQSQTLGKQFYNETEFKVFIHHPGHLLEALQAPKYIDIY